MNEVCGIVSTTPLKQPSGAINCKISFMAAPKTEEEQVDEFIKEQQKRQKQAEKDRRTNKFIQWGTFGAFLTLAGLGIAAYVKEGNIAKSTDELKKTVWEDITKENSLADMALPDSLKKFAEKFKRSSEKADIIKKRGGEPIKSVLMYGPPGTGKTSFAKAIAKEFPDSKFASIDMTTLDSEYKSVGNRNLKNAIDMICKEADKNPKKKIFVFLDEIDSIMMTDNSMNNFDSNKTLNVFKRELNNLTKRDNILVIGATNLTIDVEKGLALGGKKLDSAMLNRFNSKVLVDLPTKDQAINKIVKRYMNVELAGDSLKNVSDKDLNTLCEFFTKPERNVSFRDIENVIKDAALTFESDTQKVEIIDLVKAIKERQNEYKFTDAEFNQLLKDLNINKTKI